MADSDGEFVANDLSDDELQITSTYETRSGRQVVKPPRGAATAAATATAASGRQRDPRPRKKKKVKAAWEETKRSWEEVVDGTDGSLAGVAEWLAEAEKRRRLLRDTTPLQRGIIRHLVLVLDMSFAMAEKDMLPNRYNRTMGLAAEFVREFYEQNPISQMGIVGMRDGVAVRISDVSGAPEEHLDLLEALVRGEPSGNPSLQNALEMCRGALFHAPSHGTREIVIVYGALLSSDPDDIRDTIARLVQDRIRVSIIGLSAQVAICAELCSRTNAGDGSYYRIALDEPHLRELLIERTTPPVTFDAAQSLPSLLMMGFPSQTLSSGAVAEYCACHKRPSREGYLCTRCGARVCRLPIECPACGLTLILSTHLARSYHHLFPLRSWVEVSWAEAWTSRACHACLAPFPDLPQPRQDGPEQRGRDRTAGADGARAAMRAKGVSESSRYACEVCLNHFCIDCDVFAHEVLHNCPGCQGEAVQSTTTAEEGEGANGHAEEGGGAGEMVVD